MKTIRAKRKEKGFTIIELVVVILLLGILTATALPRFIDVTTQAHGALIDGVQGGLQTSLALYNAAWTAQGQPAANTVITSFGDGTLRTNADGYPRGDGDGETITNDVAGATNCGDIYTSLLQAGAPSMAATGLAATPTVTEINSATTDFIPYVTAVDICNYAYTAEGASSGSTVRILTYDSTAGSATSGTITMP